MLPLQPCPSRSSTLASGSVCPGSPFSPVSSWHGRALFLPVSSAGLRRARSGEGSRERLPAEAGKAAQCLPHPAALGHPLPGPFPVAFCLVALPLGEPRIGKTRKTVGSLWFSAARQWLLCCRGCVGPTARSSLVTRVKVERVLCHCRRSWTRLSGPAARAALGIPAGCRSAGHSLFHSPGQCQPLPVRLPRSARGQAADVAC